MGEDYSHHGDRDGGIVIVMTTFKELRISDSVCETLRYKGIKEATPVQEASIPLVRAGRDVIVQAQDWYRQDAGLSAANL